MKTALHLVIWALIFWVAFLVFRNGAHFQPVTLPLPTPSPIQSATAPACGPLPGNGYGSEYEPSFLHRSDLTHSGIMLENRQAFPVVAIILSAAGNRKIMSVAIMSGQSVNLSLPIADYGLALYVGNRWCNMERGFLDGQKIDISGTFTIQDQGITRITLKPSGPSTGDVQVVYGYDRPSVGATAPAMRVDGDGALLLQQENGGYFVAGHVNQVPVRFQVDTGAMLTSISRETAGQAGILECEPRTFHTAGGDTSGCVGMVSEIEFGNFHVRYVTVAVMPNMRGSLLGMNVLGKFTMEQHGNTLRILK